MVKIVLSDNLLRCDLNLEFFEKIISKTSVVKDYDVKSDTLWVLFGGINGGLGVKILEFGTITKSFPIKKLFIRDMQQSFYQRGILEEENVNSVDDLKNFLQIKIEEANVKKLAFIGNSAGGYAALLFARLLNIVDEVHAFAPQTFLDNSNRKKNNDHTLPEIYAYLNNEMKDKSYFDLKEVYSKYEFNDKGDFYIYYDKTFEIDRIHAERMGIFPGVILQPYKSGGHDVIKEMKMNGELSEVLNRCYKRLREI
jgi:hypothetical protein